MEMIENSNQKQKLNAKMKKKTELLTLIGIDQW